MDIYKLESNTLLLYSVLVGPEYLEQAGAEYLRYPNRRYHMYLKSNDVILQEAIVNGYKYRIYIAGVWEQAQRRSACES